MRYNWKDMEGLLYVLWLAAFIAAVVWIVVVASGCENRVEPRYTVVWDVNTTALPAPGDVQELLNRIEPEPRLKVDGRIGPATLAKWNRVYCEVSARQYHN